MRALDPRGSTTGALRPSDSRLRAQQVLRRRSWIVESLAKSMEARQAMVALNEKNSETGRAPLNYGIGVQVGDVMYGNIGSRTRLDFTVISQHGFASRNPHQTIRENGAAAVPRVRRLRRR